MVYVVWQAADTNNIGISSPSLTLWKRLMGEKKLFLSLN